MQPDTGEEALASRTNKSQAQCQVDHGTWSKQKTARIAEPVDKPIECDDNGVWHVRGFAQARAILRSKSTKQAGFNADMIGNVPNMKNQPILYQEGKTHDLQRKQTARFFTPRTVSTKYRLMMEQLSDQMVAELQRKKRIDLSQLTMRLSMRVTCEVVGLKNSRIPGIERRIYGFFTDASSQKQQRLSHRLRTLMTRGLVLAFFFLDVKPAIQERKHQPEEDVISHLLEQHYNDTEILTECLTYGAAGMVTTREFISASAWHFLEHTALRARYLAAPEEERHAMLEEVLRLEPVVGNILRRATASST